MKGLFIPGKKKPTSCYGCEYQRYYAGLPACELIGLLTNVISSGQSVNSNCPLIEIDIQE